MVSQPEELQAGTKLAQTRKLIEYLEAQSNLSQDQHALLAELYSLVSSSMSVNLSRSVRMGVGAEAVLGLQTTLLASMDQHADMAGVYPITEFFPDNHGVTPTMDPLPGWHVLEPPDRCPTCGRK